MAGKPPEVKILGDASGAKKAAKEAAGALGDVEDAAAKTSEELGDLGEEGDDALGKVGKGAKDAEDKVSRFGDSADRVRGRVGDLADELKSRLGPAGELAGDKIDGLAERVGKVPPAALAAAGGVAAVTGAVVALGSASIGRFLDEAEQVRQVQDVFTSTAEDASKLTTAAEQLGLSSDQLADFGAEFASNVGGSVDDVEALGVEVVKTADGTTDMVGTFKNAITTLGNTKDAAERARIGNELFGESWSELAPLVRAGGQELDRLGEIAEEQGLIFDEEDIRNAERMKQALDDAKKSADDILVSLGKDLAPGAAHAASEIARLAKASEQGGDSIGVLDVPMQLLTGSMKAGGDAAGFLADRLGLSREEFDAQRAAAEAGAEAQERAEQQAAETAAAEDALRQTLDDLTAAEDRARQAHDDRVNAALGLIAGTLDVERSERAVERALIDQERASRDLDTAINEHGAESEEARLAALNLRDSEDGVKDALYRQAAASAEARIKTEEVAGKQLDAAGKAAIQRDELSKLAATLEPGSPLRQYLEGLIAKLDEIPRHIPVEIQISQAGLNPALIASANQQVAAALAGRAGGGPVSANQPYVVGEEGPELFIPKASGTVIPNDGFTSSGPAPSGMWGQRAQAPQPIVVQVMVDKRELGRAVVEVQRSR